MNTTPNPTPERMSNEQLRSAIADHQASISGDPDAGYALTNGDVQALLEELLERRLSEGAPSENLDALIAPILARIDPEKIATHGPDCYQWHVECLALAVHCRLSEGVLGD